MYSTFIKYYNVVTKNGILTRLTKTRLYNIIRAKGKGAREVGGRVGGVDGDIVTRGGGADGRVRW